MTTKETKSARLFRHAFYEAKSAIKSFGAGKIDALSSLHDETDECICQRTVNAIRKHAEQKLKAINWDLKYATKRGLESIYEEADREAVAIVLHTCDNWERDEAEFKASLATI